VYPTDVGYVPRKVGLHGHLLELCRGSIREPVKSLLVSVIILTPQYTDLCLFGRLHGFPRTGKVQVFDPDLHRTLRHVAHSVLRVGS
jgi:hypothetical protein